MEVHHTQLVFCSLVGLSFGFLPPSAEAATLRVPGDYATIQEAVDAAAVTGDRIEVAPGIYDEDVVVPGKNLSIEGDDWGESEVQSFTWQDGSNSGGMISRFLIRGQVTADLRRPFRLEESTIYDNVYLQLLDDVSFYTVTVANCTAFNAIDLDTVGNTVSSGQAIVTNCSILGTADLSTRGASARIDNCILPLASIDVFGAIESKVSNSYVAQGNIRCHGDETATASDNHVANGDLTVSAHFDAATARRNLVYGGKLWVSSEGEVHALNNELYDGSSLFLALSGLFPGSARNNVVAGCVRGIDVSSNLIPVEIVGNTVVNCSDFGIRSTGSETILANNIVVSSGTGVFLPAGTDPNAVTCNDVWSNTVNWSGFADPTGTHDNISLDPLFCSGGSVEYLLTDASPCSEENNPTCGRIGARGVDDCSSTSGVDAPWEGTGPSLRAWPNPTAGRVNMEFDLQRTGSVRVEVFDASGSRVWGREVIAEPGTNTVTWNRASNDGDPIPAGVYLIRVRNGVGEAKTAKVVLTER